MTTFPPAWAYFVLVVTSAVLLKAAWTDLREYKIRNELILALAGLFVLYAILTDHWAQLKWDLAFAALMFVVLLAIATTDLLFAFDSIPAVFGVTQHPYVVFTANAFALLGMRALYFLVVGLLDRLVYLSLGLATILAFIGVKLILHFLHGEVHAVPEISTGASVAVIALVLLITTLASLLRPRRDSSARAQSAPSQIHASPHWPNEPGARSCVRQRA